MSFLQSLADEEPECANCGCTEGQLLRCSRCRSEYFCSAACQRSYWPFHRDQCKSNEFADALEATEPKMAAWMRKHGKLAVLKDEEVERLERAGKAACGTMSRDDVMSSMYGRLDPKPIGPSYSIEETRAIKTREEEERRQARLLSAQDKCWNALVVPEGLGVETARYKFRQNQSHIEVFFLVPRVDPRTVKVVIRKKELHVGLSSDPTLPWLSGQLFQEVMERDSTWIVADGVLHISLLKKHRRGHYAAGATNAETWWRSLMSKAGDLERIQLQHPPTRYYWQEYEEDDIGSPAATAAAPRLITAAAAAPR